MGKNTSFNLTDVFLGMIQAWGKGEKVIDAPYPDVFCNDARVITDGLNEKHLYKKQKRDFWQGIIFDRSQT
mgnify:CR=1 FL=1